MNLIDFVNSLACEKACPGDKKILDKLQDFECGDFSNSRTTLSEESVSKKMLERFRMYLSDNSESSMCHDIYYVIGNSETIFLFFSLQASQVYNSGFIQPEDFGKLCSLKCQSNGNDEFTKDNVDLQLFQEMLKAYRLDKYVKDEGTLIETFLCLSSMVKAREKDKQNNVFANATFPCIELVNFCKNLKADKIWHELNYFPSMGASLFWLHIIPIIEKMRQSIGCTYVSLFAADESLDNKEKLISYYNQVLFFQNDENLSAVKPQYDWKCIFLCQKVRVLVEHKNSFIKNYLVDTNMEDDV